MTATLLCLALLVAATGTALGLGRLPLGRRPGLVLLVGTTAALVGLLSLLATVLVTLAPTPSWRREGCTGCEAVLTFAACVFLAVGLGCALALVLACAEQTGRRNSAARRRARMLLADARTERREIGGHEVHLIPRGQGAMALRLDGRRVIGVDRDLAARLSEAELRAVVEHEAAHLALWHDRVRWVVRVVTGAFGWVPGLAPVEARVHLLCEAAADDRAARKVGDLAVRSALMRATAPTCVPSPRRTA